MITRDLASELKRSAAVWPCITLSGPRQSGKTTLCRALFPDHGYANLEAPDIQVIANEDPRAFLAQFREGAILDEVQRAPALIGFLRGIIDEDCAPGRWILTASQSLELVDSAIQSLAGLSAHHKLLPLSYGETKRFSTYPETIDKVLYSGSYPRIYAQQLDPADWFSSYVGNYIERDVRLVTNVEDLRKFQRFLRLCAGRTAQSLNLSGLAWDCGISQPTANAWLGILEAHYIVFRLPAYRYTTRRRLAKLPKLHFYDTGLACWLMGIRTPDQLLSHWFRWRIFETWMVSEIAKHRLNAGTTDGLYHYLARGAQSGLAIQDTFGTRLLDARTSEMPLSEMWRGVERAQKQVIKSGDRCSATVVYGGDKAPYPDSDCFLQWQNLQGVDWCTAVPQHTDVRGFV